MSTHSQAVKEVYISMLYSLIQKGLLLSLISHSAGQTYLQKKDKGILVIFTLLTQSTVS